jgi:DNA mismatch repair protein MutS
MKVKEWKNKVIFQYTVEKGIAKGSYGIHVASLAGIPNSVLMRAKVKLEQYESAYKNFKDIKVKTNKEPEDNISEDFKNIFDSIISDIKSSDLDEISPREALEKLYAYNKSIKKLDK